MKCTKCNKKLKATDTYIQDMKKGIVCEDCLDRQYASRNIKTNKQHGILRSSSDLFRR